MTDKLCVFWSFNPGRLFDNIEADSHHLQDTFHHHPGLPVKLKLYP